MVLVDTSVWIRHLREGSERLGDLLESRRVLCHPYVVGELALGNLRHRHAVLTNLMNLPGAVKAIDAEVLRFVEDRNLAGKGIGWVDAHLLVSAYLSGSSLWTADRNLEKVAADLDLESFDL